MQKERCYSTLNDSIRNSVESGPGIVADVPRVVTLQGHKSAGGTDGKLTSLSGCLVK